MSKFVHSSVLFVDDDGLEMKFSSSSSEIKNQVQEMIEYGGGVFQRSDEPGVYRLVPLGVKFLNLTPGITALSVNYILDCVSQNCLLEMDSYIVKEKAVNTSDISEDEDMEVDVENGGDGTLTETISGRDRDESTSVVDSEKEKDCDRTNSKKSLTVVERGKPKTFLLYENSTQNSLDFPETVNCPQGGNFSLSLLKAKKCRSDNVVRAVEENEHMSDEEGTNAVATGSNFSESAMDNVYSVGTATSEIDGFDTFLLKKLELQKQNLANNKAIEEHVSEQVSSSSDLVEQSSSQQVSTNNSDEIFADDIGASGSLTPNPGSNSQDLQSIGSQNDKTLEALSNMLLEYEEMTPTPESENIRSKMKELRDLILERKLTKEVKEMWRNETFTIEEKCTLLKMVCVMRKQQPNDVLEQFLKHS